MGMTRAERIFNAIQHKPLKTGLTFENTYIVVYTEKTFVGTHIGPDMRLAYFDLKSNEFVVKKAIIYSRNSRLVKWVKLPKRMVEIIYLKLWPDNLPTGRGME